MSVTKVLKLVRSIEDKRMVAIKRNPADIRKMLDEEEGLGNRPMRVREVV